MAFEILALALLSVNAHGAKHSVMWAIPVDPPTIEVAVGDVIEFTWTGSQNVWSLPDVASYDACDVTKGTQVCTQSPCRLRLIAYADPVLFVSQKAYGADCRAGMKMNLTMPSLFTTTPLPYKTINQSLSAPATPLGGKHSVMWQIPLDPPALVVNLGDTVEFKWTGHHNVWSLPDQAAYDKCDVPKGTQICSESPCSLNIIAYAGPMYFACQKGNGANCRDGMKMNLTMNLTEPSSSTSTGTTTTTPFVIPFEVITQWVEETGFDLNQSDVNRSGSADLSAAASVDPAKALVTSLLVAALGLRSG